MAQTVALLVIFAAVWIVFTVLVRQVRRRGVRGEYPGVGERGPEPVADPATQRAPGRWKDGHRPWH